MVVRLNIGCGRSPTPGWLNYDNSPAIWIARSRALGWVVGRLGLLDAESLAFAEFCRGSGIRYANAAAHIPHATGSVDAIYSSHMLEHLDRVEVRSFLAECRRVLKKDGMLRLVVPDLHHCATQYLKQELADRFLENLQFDLDKPRGMAGRLRQAISGGRRHHWMYDRKSLASVVGIAGFTDVEVVSEGATRILDPGHLDLHEREEVSLCIEARRP